MENVPELEQKIFFELKIILENLSKISTAEELISKQEMLGDLTDRVAFLRILEKNKDYLIPEEEAPFQPSDADHFAESLSPTPGLEEPVEEEVLFTTELNELEEDESAEESAEVNTVESEPPHTEVLIPDETAEIEIANPDTEHTPPYQSRREIIDIENEAKAHREVPAEDSAAVAEKKFKLANIKGLKAVQDLFSDDPLESLPKNEPMTQDSLRKNNRSTDYMEAPAKKPEFKLDLNDKVAFTKVLFNGDAEALNETVKSLNSFDNLEAAKAYLSDLYHTRKWTSVDEYAQRLWNLVEHKLQ